jgi:hypothetical protein
MDLNSRFRRREEVAAKVIDGEAIIINLANGVYYSMDKAGALIWELLENGQPLDQIARAVVARYDIAAEKARDDVARLAGELVQENLLELSTDKSEPCQESESLQDHKLIYESPALNIYRDMGDLLALDPPVPGLGDTPWKEPEEPSK